MSTPGDLPEFDPSDEAALSKRLSDADRAALDALIDAELDLSRVPPHLRERAEAVARVLGLLDTHAGDREAVISATLDRIVAQDAREAEPAQLCPADDDALEALVSAGFDPRRVAGGMRDRATRQLDFLRLLDTPEASPMAIGREALIAKSMERVRQAQAAGLGADTVLQGGGRRGWRLADLVSVAAMLLIGTAVIWPIASSMRAGSQRAACTGNMAGIGAALSQYASGFRDSLPVASAARAGTPWWHVGDPERSNSANLFLLRRAEFASAGDMACAGNPWALPGVPSSARDWPELANVSYSYQNMFAHQRPTFSQAPRMVVLVDRSPVVLKAVRGEWIDPLENSPNHAGRGQTALHLDGSAAWMTTPVTESGDNIWLPADLEAAIREVRARGGKREAEPLKGRESPAAKDDVFVGP